MQKLVAVLVLLVLLPLAACSDLTDVSDGLIVATTDQTSYRQGDKGVLTLSNQQRDRIMVNTNLCTTIIERKDG